MVEQQKFDVAMCVGGSFYPTHEHFCREAERQGVSKRIVAPIKNLRQGARLFLLHDSFQLYERLGKAGQKLIKKDIGVRSELMFFGMCLIERVDLVCWDPEKVATLQKEVKNTRFRLVPLTELRSEAPRGCGRRHYGGGYMMSDSDFDVVQKLADSLNPDAMDLRGTLIQFRIPVPTSQFEIKKRFLGYRYVVGDEVIEAAGLTPIPEDVRKPAVSTVKLEKKKERKKR